jgi:hypothetical protein
VRDYTVSYRGTAGGPLTELVAVKGNFQRLNRHMFKPVAAQAIRIHVHAAGDKLARIFEVRCYG